MLTASFQKRLMVFNEAGGTSRGVLHSKPSWFIRVKDENGSIGIGECSIIPGLSIDDSPKLERRIEEVCENINSYVDNYHSSLHEYPAIRFALETAFLGLKRQHPFNLIDSAFVNGEKPIVINGLIWMGQADKMLKRIDAKLEQGFSCLKLKVGAIDFESELSLLNHIRKRYSIDDLELRVDANGAFSSQDAAGKLDVLAQYGIHSIEQPIKAGQPEAMYELCRRTPLSIALDEELIGVNDIESKRVLLKSIQPQYIILKPSLLGGLKASDEWIDLAEIANIGWWATSALEANVGLNAIAQWVAAKNNPMRQGLGTGQVFSNNIESPLYLKGEELYYNPLAKWGNPFEE